MSGDIKKIFDIPASHTFKQVSMTYPPFATSISVTQYKK
jgi:hypothetical protein